MSENPEKRIRLELLGAFMSPEFLSQDRRELANRIKEQFMKDPELLAGFERLLASHATNLAQVMPTAEELKSFGWSEEDGVDSPAHAAAQAAAHNAAATCAAIASGR